MNFEEALNETLVNLELQAKTKVEAIRELIELLYQEGKVNDRDLFLQDVYEREAEGRTGIGNRVVIRYCKSDAVAVTSIVIGRSEWGLMWDSSDDQLVRIVILFAMSNEDKTKLHLSLSGQITNALADERILERLLSTEDKKEVISLLAGD
ncbi:MAG: putative IIA-like nitrogen-regulatory protein PtsN [Massilibacillus sp.]|jgi:PTS system fructose-specific IIA component|nr:putative IIA-like nitrogen-regulatory protein PtsN [Massilibacillus sp.]